jgi:hypothetical protein
MGRCGKPDRKVRMAVASSFELTDGNTKELSKYYDLDGETEFFRYLLWTTNKGHGQSVNYAQKN